MGMYSHAEGSGTISGGRSSHAEGDGTITNNVAEHAEGSYNKSHSTKDGDSQNTLHSVGIGTSMANRKNAVEVMQNGDQYVLGIGGYDGQAIDEAKTVQEVVNGKQDALKVNEENPTIELTSLTIGDIIYKIAGTATLGKTFTTDITVGHLTAGTELKTTDTLADLLFKMLVGSVTKVDLYYGGCDNIPTGLDGLNKITFEKEADFMPVWSQNIIRGAGADRYGQYAVIAVPDKYKVTQWVVDGFEYPIEYNEIALENYNVYYIISKGDDSPDGINYKITVEENV